MWARDRPIQRRDRGQLPLDAGAHRHQPGCARGRVSGPMMLKAVPAGIFVCVPAKVRENDQSGLARIFRFALQQLPKFSAQPVGPADALDVQRVRPCVSHINVVHRDPQKAGSHLPDQLAHNVKRQLVGTGERLGMRPEIGCRKLEDHFQLLQFEFSISQFRRVIRVLIVVASRCW
jgi:hypothetical protein